jgi:2'-5' RNA ligase
VADETGGMIALVPTDSDAKQLAVSGGHAPPDLHLTLAYLGDDVTGLDADTRDQLANDVSAFAAATAPIRADVFAHAAFNPNGDQHDPCAAYVVNGVPTAHVDAARHAGTLALGDAMPDPHPNFIPHVTAGYGIDAGTLDYTGPVTFDRVRLALGDDVTDYPLTGTQEDPMPDTETMADHGIPVRFPVLAVEGLSTSDGRFIDPGALDHRPLPLPILAQTQTPVGGGGHDGAHVIGRIDTMTRVAGPSVVSKVTGKPFPDGTFVWVGAGHIDPAAPAAALAQKGYLTGNSVDLSEVEAFIEDDPNAQPLDDEAGGVKIGGPSGERMRLTRGVIAATTLVPIPAFADAYVELDGATVAPAPGLTAAATPPWRAAELGDDTCLPCAAAAYLNGEGPDTLGVAPALVAAAPPATLPPIEWFRDPALPGPTPLTVDDDGRVYGHLAAWNTCHTGFTGRCVMAPRSRTDYAHFRVGSRRVLGDDGQPTQIGVGALTVVLDPDAAGHAPAHLAAMPAAAHYDNAGCQVASVEVGEDAHGIWVAGALRSTATPEQVEALLAAPLSGDWRPVNGHLELVAALGVNTPGFPLPRARVASGQVVSLVAAGAIPRPAPAATDDALADAIATKVAAKLGVRLTPDPMDESVSALAARRAAAVKALVDADLTDRYRAVSHLFVDDMELAANDADALIAAHPAHPWFAEEAWGDLADDAVDGFNWVTKAGGLPKYIKRIAKHLKAKGMDASRAIATAVNAAKKMCATGDVNFPGKQQVNPGSKAEACAAVADWEAKKAKS